MQLAPTSSEPITVDRDTPDTLAQAPGGSRWTSCSSGIRNRLRQNGAHGLARGRIYRPERREDPWNRAISAVATVTRGRYAHCFLNRLRSVREARTRPMVGRLLAGSCLMAVCVIIHAAGLSSAIRQLRRSALPGSRFWRSTWLFVVVAVWIVLLHLAEISIWA